jgi:Fe-S cluster biosynthesis and repair protein YggX
MATIVCARCGATTEALARPPLTGKRGLAVQQQTCPTCWQEWKQYSVNLINHYGLLPMVPEHREQIFSIMQEFLQLREDGTEETS